jgi:hypothetical protein
MQARTKHFVYEYQYEKKKREVDKVSRFSNQEAKELIDKIKCFLISEERNYTYKFIDRNCTTMVVDKINETVGKRWLKKQMIPISYREVYILILIITFVQTGNKYCIWCKKTDQNEKLFTNRIIKQFDKATIY